MQLIGGQELEAINREEGKMSYSDMLLFVRVSWGVRRPALVVFNHVTLNVSSLLQKFDLNSLYITQVHMTQNLNFI